MQSKTLNTIQTLVKIGKVISYLTFVFSIIGAIGCAVGLFSLLVLPEFSLSHLVIEIVKLENKTAHTLNTVYAQLSIGIIMFVGEIIVARYDYLFFKKQLEVGTPFDFKIASMLKVIGIKTIVIPIICTALGNIVYAIFVATLKDVGHIPVGEGISIGFGIMLLIFSFVCRYGAEISQERESKEEDINKKI